LLFDYVEAGKYYETDSANCWLDLSEKVLCFPAPSWSSCLPTSCSGIFNPEFTPERERISRELADITHFSKDPAVIVVRAAMRDILDKVAGGNDPADDASTTLPEDSGMLVDPWVDEPACGANAPWGYPAP
jgi:hypothetical protein